MPLLIDDCSRVTSRLCLFLLSLISGFVVPLAANAIASPVPATAQTTTSPSDNNPSSTVTIYCPNPAALVKDPQQLTWSTTDKQWQSYDVSFDNQLTQFIGAQWHGVGVGQVFCLYRSDDKDNFPVLLAFHALALVPRTDSWGTDLGGYRNCTSNQQSECGFEVRVRPQQVDLYQQALKLKINPSNSP